MRGQRTARVVVWPHTLDCSPWLVKALPAPW